MAQATRDIVGDIFETLRDLTPGQLRRLMQDLPLKFRRELIERWQGRAGRRPGNASRRATGAFG